MSDMRLARFVLINFLVFCVVPPALAQSSARKILDEMIASLGGQAFLNVREIHTKGRFFSFSKGELAGSDIFADYIRFPDMERTEFGKEKNKEVLINRGSEGWIVKERDKTAEPQPAQQAEEFVLNFKTSLDYVLRFVINDPKATVQSLGSEIMDFKRADVIELRDPEKNRIRFYIDRTSRLPVKMQVRPTGDREVREELYGNWHELQGVKTPLFVGRYKNGVKTMEIRAETAAYNSGLTDNLFAVPATK